MYFIVLYIRNIIKGLTTLINILIIYSFLSYIENSLLCFKVIIYNFYVHYTVSRLLIVPLEVAVLFKV